MSFIDICRFRFDKIEKSYMKESQIKKCALVNGREFEEKELNLSFKEWDELFSDSDNKYCDLINLYSHENELPYNSQDLRWDSEKVVLWHCCFGHSWEKRISEYTSRMQFYNPCPICRNQIPGLSPRILESSAELIIDTIQYYINYYKEENLGKLRTILEGECKQIKRILDEALDSHSSLWLNDANMPTQIRYYFIYPNGKQADIDMYICDRNGSVKEIYEFLYEGVISTDYKEEIELLYNSLLYNYRNKIGEYIDILCEKYSATEVEQIINNTELSDFLEHYHLSFKYERLSSALKYLTKFSLNPQEVDHELYRIRPKTSEYRQNIYNQVVFEGKSSGRWVSEQSLYRIVRTFFKDAIYQYHVAWLEHQSLDIYIPSIMVGIEYQGIQHYKAIEIFGGETALKDRKALDAKKRRLCKKNGVTLYEWKYTQEISRQAVFELLYEWIRKRTNCKTEEA